MITFSTWRNFSGDLKCEIEGTEATFFRSVPSEKRGDFLRWEKLRWDSTKKKSRWNFNSKFLQFVLPSVETLSVSVIRIINRIWFLAEEFNRQ